jgi:CRP-like cAMP-binding protein
VTDKPELIERVLRAAQFFQGWPEARFGEVRAVAELWRYEEGESIAERGDPAKGLYIVADGSVTSHRDSPGGRHMLLHVMTPGIVTGVVPVLDNGPMPMSHAARSRALVILIPQVPLRRILHTDIEVLIKVTHFLSHRSRAEYEGLYSKTTETKRVQLAKYLAYLPRRAVFLSEGAPGDKGWIEPQPFDMTQDELAAMIGVSRQTLNRLIAPLLREKIVERRANVVRVASFRKLLAIIEEDDQIPEEWRQELLSWDEHANDAGARNVRSRESRQASHLSGVPK